GLRQIALPLLLHCRSSYRGVIHHFHDCLGCHVALGTIHNIVQDAVAGARARNAQVPLSAVDCGLLDEIFQAQRPVLVGVDAASTYCFLLSQESNRDGVTWGVRLLELQDRGLAPDAFLAAFAPGLPPASRPAGAPAAVGRLPARRAGAMSFTASNQPAPSCPPWNSKPTPPWRPATSSNAKPPGIASATAAPTSA